MSYRVELAKKAIEDVLDLTPALREALRRGLRELAEDPVGRSRRGGYPIPKGQQFHINLVHEGRRFLISVLFTYRDEPTENVLQVIAVGHADFGPASAV
jgi:hypothetical protein